MLANTMVLRGDLIQEGVRFLWWVIDGTPSQVTVSHPVRGTRTGDCRGADPLGTARELAKEILASPS